MYRSLLSLFLLLSASAGAAEFWLATSQSNRDGHVWETRITPSGFYESFFARGAARGDADGRITHCGAIPLTEMSELRDKVAQLRRRNDGNVRPDWGKGKYPPRVTLMVGKNEDRWKGERAEEITLAIEDMTHPDPDQGIALSVFEWTKTNVEQWDVDRDGQYRRLLTQRAVDGVAAKEVSRDAGPVCREELRTIRKWIHDSLPALKKKVCDKPTGDHYFEFLVTDKSKPTSFKCDGPPEKLPPAFHDAWSKIKVTPYRAQPETK